MPTRRGERPPLAIDHEIKASFEDLIVLDQAGMYVRGGGTEPDG